MYILQARYRNVKHKCTNLPYPFPYFRLGNQNGPADTLTSALCRGKLVHAMGDAAPAVRSPRKINKSRFTCFYIVDQAKCPTPGSSPGKNRGIRGCGGIGRLIGFRFQRASVQVRVLSSAPKKKRRLQPPLRLFALDG